MTDKQLAVKFAEFLGWHLAEVETPFWWAGLAWVDSDNIPHIAAHQWAPCTDLNQAWLGYILLRQRGHGCYVIAEPNDAFEARIYEPKPPYHVVIAQDNDHPARAMVRACLEAAGEYDA